MATLKLKVVYADGREEQFLATPKAQVEAERYFKNKGGVAANEVEYSYWVAWASLHYAGKEPNDFDSFLGLIAEADIVKPKVEDEQSTDPTPTGVASTGSSD